MAREALFIERQLDHFFALFSEGERLGASDGARVVCRQRLVYLFGGSEGQRAMFHGADAIETPGGVGDGLDELPLDGAAWGVMNHEFIAECLVGLEVVGRENYGLAGEAVAKGVEAGALFAFGRSGAGGVVHGVAFLAYGEVGLLNCNLAWRCKGFGGFWAWGG